MMLTLLFFAALPTVWVLIMSFREQSVIFEQTFQNSNVAYGAAIAVTLFIVAAMISFYVARLNQRLTS